MNIITTIVYSLFLGQLSDLSVEDFGQREANTVRIAQELCDTDSEFILDEITFGLYSRDEEVRGRCQRIVAIYNQPFDDIYSPIWALPSSLRYTIEGDVALKYYVKAVGRELNLTSPYQDNYNGLSYMKKATHLYLTDLHRRGMPRRDILWIVNAMDENWDEECGLIYTATRVNSALLSSTLKTPPAPVEDRLQQLRFLSVEPYKWYYNILTENEWWKP